MDQLRQLIARLSWKQRISVVIAAAAAFAGLFAFVQWKHESDFRPLYTAMAPEDAATVVQKLRETGVEYRLSENAGSVMVPSSKLAESRLALAAAGLPKTGRLGFELFDKSSFGTTEFVEHINYKRALEGELERSVMSMAEVEQARVHLTLPKNSVFLDQQQPAKASVMVKLRPGARISPQNILAVTNLVASAVEGLSPDAVALVDMEGNLLSRPKRGASDPAEVTSEAIEVRQQLERNLVAKINSTLEPLLGSAAFRAGASVDCDLTSGEQQEEVLDPSKSVMLSSQKTEESTERASAGGIPGTAANLPNPPVRQPGGSGVSRRTENVTYQSSRIVRQTHIPQGVIKRMSLAVLVDQGVQWEGQGAERRRVLIPPSPDTLKTIKDLVAGVTGFSAERGDQLIVETLPFESSLKSAPPSSNPAVPAVPATRQPAWLEFAGKYRDLWAPAGLALAVLVLLLGVISRFTGRKRVAEAVVSAPAEIEAPAAVAPVVPAPLEPPQPVWPPIQLPNENREPAALPAGYFEAAERVRQVAKSEPAAMLNVLRVWLQEGNR